MPEKYLKFDLKSTIVNRKFDESSTEVRRKFDERFDGKSSEVRRAIIGNLLENNEV